MATNDNEDKPSKGGEEDATTSSEDTFLKLLDERMGALALEQSNRPSVLDEVSVDGIASHIRKLSCSQNSKWGNFP